MAGGCVGEMEMVCAELWEEIQEENRRVKDLRTVTRIDISFDREATSHSEFGLPTFTDVNILREKIRRLSGEIKVLKQTQPLVLPPPVSAQKEVLKEKLATSISQLKEILMVVRLQKKSMNETNERKKELVTQLEGINENLTAKVEDEPQTKLTRKRFKKELQDKETRIKQFEKTLMKSMVRFLNEHYPLPTAEDIKSQKKRKTRQSLQTAPPESGYHSLKTIIERLLNRCLETPHNAYVVVDSKYWQPYVSLLIRYNIATFHPEDDRRIRLVPFHV